MVSAVAVEVLRNRYGELLNILNALSLSPGNYSKRILADYIYATENTSYRPDRAREEPGHSGCGPPHREDRAGEAI